MRPVASDRAGRRKHAGESGSAGQVTTIEIDVEGRWDALALSELLIPFHSFLVHHEQERWVVHARAPGFHDESLVDAIEVIDEWWASHGRPRAASCRVDGNRYVLGRGPVAERIS